MEDLDCGDFPECFSSYYKFVKILGKGSFGKVAKAVDRYTSSTCAVKVIKKHKLAEGAVAEMKQEAEILARLNHPNIVKFLHVRETKYRLFIAMEYVRGGTLGTFLKKRKLRETQVVAAMQGILQAVACLHQHGFVHRDLKPENLLISNPRDLSSVKVADFGLSTHLGLQSRTDEKCGTLLFMAPELAANQHYGKEVDLWSCGIILYMLLTGQHPLCRSKQHKAAYLLALQAPTWCFPSRFPVLAQNLFLNLVHSDPLERYSARQALKHPWISEHSEIPMTFVEKMRKYEDEVKLRGIVYALLFISKLKPRQFYARKDLPPPRRVKRMNTQSPQKSTQSRSKALSWRPASPFRPITAPRQFRLK